MIDAPADISFLVHGTTQGLNAFLERRRVPVPLLATAGAEDTYHIARGPRTRLYDLHYRKPEPLVPRRDTLGIGGRLAADGTELEPLDEQAVRDAAVAARERGLGAIAIAFLFSYHNPAHELRAREIVLEELGEDFTVSLSHEAAKEWREYERTSSVVVESKKWWTIPATRPCGDSRGPRRWAASLARRVRRLPDLDGGARPRLAAGGNRGIRP